MLLRGLIFFANVFVVAYGVDAIFSIVEELFRLATGSFALVGVRNLIATGVMLAAPLALLAMVLTPRARPSVLFPLAACALWGAFGAAPLGLLFEGVALRMAPLVVQAGLLGLALLRIRSSTQGRSWLIETGAPQQSGKSAFSPLYSVLSLTTLAVVGSFALILYLPLMLMTSMQTMTDGFVRFDLQGVDLADRRYSREGRELRLVGMMHIGENEGYSALVESFAGESTVILAEGVSDQDGLLDQGLSYEGLAEGLGLDTQGSIEAYLDQIDVQNESGEESQRPIVRHADVDARIFHPETREILIEVGNLWNQDDILAAFLRFAQKGQDSPKRIERFQEDVLDRRNEHLLEGDRKLRWTTTSSASSFRGALCICPSSRPK